MPGGQVDLGPGAAWTEADAALVTGLALVLKALWLAATGFWAKSTSTLCRVP
jgi:hypothetical protein